VKKVKKELIAALVIAISLTSIFGAMASGGDAGNGHDPASANPGQGNGQEDGKGHLCPNDDGGDLIKTCERTGPADEEGNPTWVCNWVCEVCGYTEACEE
jgi:hypothetical protein